MNSSALALTKKLIAIESRPDNHKALKACLDLCKKELSGFTIENFSRNGYKSILAYTGKKRPAKFKLILNGHLDIIPGKKNQYTPIVKKNRLYGVGSMDMKANLVSLIHAFKETAKKVNYPLGLQIVTEEELGGFDGTKLQIEEGVNADFVISGETTKFNIVNKAKGILWLKIKATGKTAHGAYTWKGENAIWKMHEFLKLLVKKFPHLKTQEWKTTVNLSRIETENDTFNKVPDNCHVWLDIRFIPEDSQKVLIAIKKMLPKGFKLEIIVNEPALFVKESNFYLNKLKEVTKEITKKDIQFYGAQGSSDARHYTRVGTAGVEFGPIGGGIGTDTEWTDMKSQEVYIEILKRFIQELL